MRELSSLLDDSPLMQWFCHVENFGPVRVPSKSTLDRYSRFLPKEGLDEISGELLRLQLVTVMHNDIPTCGKISLQEFLYPNGMVK